MTIKNFVGKNQHGENNKVKFSHYFDGALHYNVLDMKSVDGDDLYQFQVPISDTGGATFHRYDSAMYFMRWIRKALENKTILKLPACVR